MYQQIIILTVLVAVSNAQVIGWKNCGGDVPSPSQIKVSNCTRAPCILVPKEKYYIDVDANSTVATSKLPFKATISILKLPIVVLEGDACQNITIGACPTVIGSALSFRFEYIVPSDAPKITTLLSITVSTDTGKVGDCFKLPVQISG